jgi:transcriptional regulator with XRE-family HTH domain
VRRARAAELLEAPGFYETPDAYIALGLRQQSQVGQGLNGISSAAGSRRTKRGAVTGNPPIQPEKGSNALKGANGRPSPDPIDIAVGVQIRARRRYMRMSQTALAHAIGVTFQQVQKYERGTNRVSASMLVKTAAALSTTAARLLDEGEAPAPEGSEELLAAFSGMGPRTREVLLSVARLLLNPG